MGTCKLRAGDRRESVIGYRSPGAKASSGGDGLSNYPAGRAAGRGSERCRPGERSARGPPLLREKPVRCLGKSRGPSGAGMGRRRALMCALLLGRQRMLRTPGAGHSTRISRTFPFASSRLKIRFQPPFPRCCGTRSPGGRGARGSRLPAPPPARPASAGRRNSSAFLPCASSLFLPLPGAAASFPTSTLPKLFSRSPERGALPQLPEAGSRLLLNFWGSRMSRMEKEIL